MRSGSRFLLLLTLLVTCAAKAWSADGRILNFDGDVRVNGKAVTANTLLNRQDTIATAEGASVRIVLSDNSVLDIDSGSTVKLSDYNFNPAAPKESKSDISVVEGTLRYVSGLIAKENPDSIGFTAGNSTIGVRGSFTGIEVDGADVRVEAMIGEATLVLKNDKGKQDAVVVPTGKATQTDPETGEVIVTASTMTNAVNAVVQAIAAAAPDASNRLSTDKGCSEGDKPLRDVARPPTDPATAAAIEAQLAALSEGELMMVMAVLINNAGHLCIDSDTVAATIAKIATVQPALVGNVAAVAALLEPTNAEKFTESAKPPATEANNPAPPTQEIVDPPINNEIPPGGGSPAPPPPPPPPPPSPE